MNQTTINAMLWNIQRYLMDRYGVDTSYRDIAPLTWYVNTGRATIDFLKKLMAAKQFMIARKLHEGGSYEEAVARIKKYIGYTEEE